MPNHAAELGWQLDDAGAKAYEHYLVTAVFDDWAADLVAGVDPPAGSRVLDVACGTGIVARHVARRPAAASEVQGVDVSPAMLGVAREKAAEENLVIAFKKADAHQLPFPDASFDAVLCQQGLQFFADRPAALREMARVAAPGGKLGLSTCRSLAHQPGYRALIDVVARHVGAGAADIVRSPYAFGEVDDVRTLLADAGLGDPAVRIAIWPARFASAEALLRGEMLSSPLADVIERLDADVLAVVLDELASRLAPHTDDEGVVFPFETLVVTAIRPR
jgi:ubiquinone/menaquinone biosynthesis C-methylase UbiE